MINNQTFDIKDKRILFIILIAIISVFSILYLSNSSVDNDDKLSSILGGFTQIKFSVNYSSIDYPEELVYYRVVDEVYEEKFNSQNLTNSNGSLPSDDDAVSIAEDYIALHGGLPEDAVLDDVETQYIEKRTIGEVESKCIPLFVEVTYHRVINGTPVVGPGDFILVTIDGNREIMGYMKSWRILEEIGKINIISPEDAIAKLKDENTIGGLSTSYSYPIIINEIYLGYYSQTPEEKQEFYKPVWVFQGVDYNGETIKLYVDAATQQ